MNIDKWDLFSICESILLISDKPVTIDQIVELLLREQEEELERLEDEALEAGETPEPEQDSSPERIAVVRRELQKLVQDAFDALVAAYQDEKRTVGRGFAVIAVAGGYQLRTTSLTAPFVRHHLQVKPTKLSRAQLETLAIIAYRQPVTRPEIEQIRGVDCGASMKVLLDRKLVRILGKKEEVGRPLLYGTSNEFLEFFRLSSLLELPTLREFQELTDEHKRLVEEELEAEAPLGNLRELADNTTKFEHDDTALIGDLDSALNGVKDTVERVAELTGISAKEEDNGGDLK